MAATGAISLAEEHLRASLADSDSFQAWCGAATSAQALARVYVLEAPPPADPGGYARHELEGLRPYAVVYTHPEKGFACERDAVGSYAGSGVLWVHLSQDVPADFERHHSVAYREWMNAVGGIIADLFSLHDSEPAGHLAIQRATLYGPWLSSEEEDGPQGSHLNGEVMIEWGEQ